MYRLLLRLGAVLAGYAFALLAAYAACYYRELQFQQAQVDTSGGMYAWGDLMTFSVVFGPLALLPTGRHFISCGALKSSGQCSR